MKKPIIKETESGLIDTYNFDSAGIPITVNIFRRKEEFVPVYEVSISSISKATEIILEKIRQELTTKVSLGMIDITNIKDTQAIEKKFNEAALVLIKKYFPDANEKTVKFLTSYLMQRSLGMGPIEVLMDDEHLEEIAINNAKEPVWIYHIKH